MDKISRTFMGASLLLLLLVCCVGIKPAATQEVPPADHDAVLYALRYSGLTSTAAALDAIIMNKRFMLPGAATILVSTNPAMDPVLARYDFDELVRVMSYHIVPENYPLDQLHTSFPVGSYIPTVLKNSTLLVTQNDGGIFEINNHELLPTDLCAIHTVACYAVNAVLDSSAPDVITASPPIGGELPPAHAPVLPHDGGFSPVGEPVLPPPAPEFAPTLPPSGFPLAPRVLAGAPAVIPPAGSLGAAPEGSILGTSATVTSSTCSMAVMAAALMISILFV